MAFDVAVVIALSHERLGQALFELVTVIASAVFTMEFFQVSLNEGVLLFIVSLKL